ncbi:MAG: glycosyltransferase family 4 protein [Amphiplicatus sp.]
MRVLIVAPNISARMGGEAVLPLNYIRELKKLGVDVKALTHARVREELKAHPVWSEGDFFFIEDSFVEKTIYQTGRLAPRALEDIVFNSAIGAVTMARLGRAARKLAREIKPDVVHQPGPVSPQFPSAVAGMNAPVIIGPMNGAMDYPPAFAKDYSQGSQAVVRVARAVSGVANKIWPGKRDAALLLAANDRTRAGLPKAVDPARVEILLDNGVDLDLWSPPETRRDEPPTFVFVGRLIWLKAVDLLIEAFSNMKRPARLLIIGDGPDRTKLEDAAKRAAHPDRPIDFAGFRPHAEIRDALARAAALVLPSLRESGGAVILESFACGTPAIVTDWGGPKDYVTPEFGVLVAPTGREEFVSGLTKAMESLAADPTKAAAMGRAARAKVEADYSWGAKAQAMTDIYARVIAASVR